MANRINPYAKPTWDTSEWYKRLFSHTFPMGFAWKSLDKKKVVFSRRMWSRYYTIWVYAYKCVLWHQIFSYTFLLILNDVINHGITFMFPIYKSNGLMIYGRQKKDELVKKHRQKGYMKWWDPLGSNFKSYQVVFSYTKDKIRYYKPIIVSRNLANEFRKNINEGKVYT